MNARQKAKQLKKTAARIKTIHFLKLATQKELVCVPEDLIKRSLATEIGLALLDANMIRWKTKDVPEMCGMRYEAIIEVLTQEDRE